MASLSTLDSTGGGGRRSFTPTATEFTPKSIETRREVLKASFVSQVIPDVHKYAAIIGLCTVPEEKAGMDDLGWHIADFLAFRALFCGENHPKAQTWLAMCDIPTLAEENPERYVHGKDRRLVGSAARPEKYQTRTGLTEREDNIRVETSAPALKDKFTQALKEKLEVVKRHKYPLLLIICGLTSLEQDIYFGSLDTDHRYTMKELRYDIGDDINHIDATIVTPALFSAGWQMNTSFGRPNCIELRGNRVEFLARQLGGLFAQDLVQIFCGWNCPALDEAKVDPDIRARERYPGPVPPSDEVKELTSQLKVKIHSCLAGELSTCHLDHSFSFAKSKDEWEILIEHREKSSDYQPLKWYERRWNELSSAQGLPPPDACFAFLGNAFGGNRASQLKHIKYLIEESYLAWPDHWASNFGQETKKDFEQFIATGHPDDLDCHEIFNALEHRARTSILGDTIVQYFDLPMPLNQRCRDFNNLEWKQQLSQTDRHSLIKHFGTVFASIPGPNVPPGVNPNNLSRLQRRLESGAGYVRASLMTRLLTSKDASEIVTGRIESFLGEVKAKQIELLASNIEIYQMCSHWLGAINMPIRGLVDTINATKLSRTAIISEDPIDTLDGEDEYDVYQGDDGYLDSKEIRTGTQNPSDARSPDQQLSSAFAPPFALMSLQDASTVECTEKSVTRPSKDITFAATPTKVVPQLRQEETGGLSPEVVDLLARESRLIMQLQITNERKERERLTAELLELLQKSEDLTLSAKTNQSSSYANQGDVFGATDDRSVPVPPCPEAKERADRKSNEKSTQKGRLEVAGIEEYGERKLQEDLKKTAHGDKKENEPIVRRKTPPHLRRVW